MIDSATAYTLYVPPTLQICGRDAAVDYAVAKKRFEEIQAATTNTTSTTTNDVADDVAEAEGGESPAETDGENDSDSDEQNDSEKDDDNDSENDNDDSDADDDDVADDVAGESLFSVRALNCSNLFTVCALNRQAYTSTDWVNYSPSSTTVCFVFSLVLIDCEHGTAAHCTFNAMH
jgi:hypothetical protein